MQRIFFEWFFVLFVLLYFRPYLIVDWIIRFEFAPILHTFPLQVIADWLIWFCLWVADFLRFSLSFLRFVFCLFSVPFYLFGYSRICISINDNIAKSKLVQLVCSFLYSLWLNFSSKFSHFFCFLLIFFFFFCFFFSFCLFWFSLNLC